MAVPTQANDLTGKLSRELLPKLTHGSLLSTELPPRWSEFNDPQAAVVVNVRNEADVALTVRFCNKLNIPFLAQNGGSGWANTFRLGKKGVIINLKALNETTVSPDKHKITIGGGVAINETVTAAANAGVLVVTGNCNCVGTIGAYLGGGYGNLMGKYGFGVDNILSMRVVTAEGKIITASPSENTDYFWALRGAGPNFGIVISAVIKAYPATLEDQLAWGGVLIFTPDKLEQVVQVMEELVLKPDMVAFMYFASGGPPTNSPVILINLFLHKGNPTTGREAFASLYNIGPIADTTAVLPYQQWNTGGDAFCIKGGRKPTYGASMKKLYPDVWRQVWDKYVEFQQKPGAENSVILLEKYDTTKGRELGKSAPAAFAHRYLDRNAVVITWYEDPALDAAAVEFGEAVRDIWRSRDGLQHNETYINFAHGDDSLEAMYGESLPRLRKLKKCLDPKNVFDQWFNIH